MVAALKVVANKMSGHRLTDVVGTILDLIW
jgi:hypothetical protein